MRQASRFNRRGAALFEAIVALAIVATAGVSAARFVVEAIHAEAALARREEDQFEADRLLAATSMLRAEELAQRLGARNVGDFVVDVQRPKPELYRIAVGDEGGIELLVTVVYRRSEPVGSNPAPSGAQ